MSYREAETRARFFGCEEGVEQAVDVLGGDAGTLVANLDHHAGLIEQPGFQERLPAVAAGLNGVDGEIQ